VCTAEPAPRIPEEQGDNEADGADDHQDKADGIDVEMGVVYFDCEIEDGPDGNQDNARSDTHDWILTSGPKVASGCTYTYPSADASNGCLNCASPSVRITPDGGHGKPPVSWVSDQARFAAGMGRNMTCEPRMILGSR